MKLTDRICDVAEEHSHIFSDTASKKNPFLNHKETVKEFLDHIYQRGYFFGLDNLKSFGVYRIVGWELDFKEVLKRFYVKQYGIISEEYARNKTAIRTSTYGRIGNITEIS